MGSMATPHPVSHFIQSATPNRYILLSLGSSVPLRTIRQHLSYGDCLEDKREDYQNCSVLYGVIIVHNHMHTDMSSSYR